MAEVLLYQNVRDWLIGLYREGKQKNPQYSLRAFAKKLSLSPGSLSDILKGKRSLSFKSAHKILNRLDFLPDERHSFLNLALSEKMGCAASDTSLHKKNLKKFKTIDPDVFYVVSDWQHYAVLGLMKTSNFQSNSKWIAKRLGITSVEVESTLSRLERVGLIKKINEQYVRINENLSTTHDIPSSALRRSHKQTLEQAISALEEIPVELRDITSISVAINPNKMRDAKDLIKNFRREFQAIMEDGKKEEVYNLNIQFIPVTKN